MTLNIPQELEDIDKAREEEEDKDLKEETEAVSIGQLVDRMK
jgi:hypothetical protein